MGSLSCESDKDTSKKCWVIVRYLIAYIFPLVANPTLINLGILRYLSSTHGNIFSHNIHFLLGRINNILRTTKQTTSELIVCCNLIASKGTSRDSRRQCNRS